MVWGQEWDNITLPKVSNWFPQFLDIHRLLLKDRECRRTEWPVPTFLRCFAANKLKMNYYFSQIGTFYQFKPLIYFLCSIVNKIWVS